MRIVPIALVIAVYAAVYFILPGFGSSLGNLAFTLFLFLALIAVFHILDTVQSSSLRRHLTKIKTFILGKAKKKEGASGTAAEIPHEELPQEAAPVSEAPRSSHGALIEINKPKKQEHTAPAADKRRSVLPFLYVTSFIVIAYWRLAAIIKSVSLNNALLNNELVNDNYGIPHALLLLLFFCIAVIYLKLRKKGRFPADKSSHGMLTLLAYASLVYAAAVTVNAVLKVNVFFILQWGYYAVSIYLITALAVNILLSILRNDVIGNFDYTIFPKLFNAGKEAASGAASGTASGAASGSFLDSDNVKLNLSLKSLYTFKYTLKILPGIVLALAFVLFLSTSVFVVQPHQGAAVYRFGRLDRSSIVGQGFHFKLPWPVDIAEVYDINRLSSLQIGYTSSGTSLDYLWTVAHDGGENLLLLGNGNEAAAVNIKIIYFISDLYSFITTSSDPRSILSAAAYESLMNRTAHTTLDTFLSVDRDLLSSSLLNEFSQVCEKENLGLSVVQVNIESVHPPVDTAQTYQRVVTASIEKNAVISIAQANAERIVIDAQRQSKVSVDKALADQHLGISSAQKEMAVYYAAMEAYRISPASFQLAKYLDTFQTIVSGSKVYVFSPGAEAGIPNLYVGGANIVNLSDQEAR